MDEQDDRLLASLPAVFRGADTAGDLRRLLSAFEAILFGRNEPGRRGIEAEIDAIAHNFAPLAPAPGAEAGMCAERFLPWLAGWVAFSPHALFSARQLRRIVAGIVPLYTRRGTRAYLEQLLGLCFEEIDKVAIDESPGAGLRLGHARIGSDSRLGTDSPFRFDVVVDVRAGQWPWGSREAWEQRVRTMIDFAKPAHTVYALRFRAAGPDWRADAAAATADRHSIQQ